jgi:hypothetical protein
MISCILQQSLLNEIEFVAALESLPSVVDEIQGYAVIVEASSAFLSVAGVCLNPGGFPLTRFSEGEYNCGPQQSVTAFPVRNQIMIKTLFRNIDEPCRHLCLAEVLIVCPAAVLRNPVLMQLRQRDMSTGCGLDRWQ